MVGYFGALGFTAAQAFSWAFALGTVAIICALAALSTLGAARYTLHRAGDRLPDWAASLLAVLVALLTFAGGWMIVSLWWLGARGTQFVHRLTG